MWVVFLEALLALALLIFIVWWTMFHGRGSDTASKKQGSADKEPPPR
ncbi:MAG TPA: hypothetical protein VFR86_16330 [Burkholderiaceae bacterium]|nr:hypothetical protein [Burkholderiaceae bacterium]